MISRTPIPPIPRIRCTVAQAVVRYLASLHVQEATGSAPLFGGMFAIFGHGNVAGLGEALYQYREQFPTYRAHNEQAMAHTAIAYAKTHFRRRMMACTTSIGPGATNLVTAAALAHVNRLPILFLPGDIFTSGDPAPVLQQVEDFQNGTISANDCLRPVSRYFERIVHPAQLLSALPRAVAILTDPAQCGPVTLAMPQDVQTMAFDYPIDFFKTSPITFRALPPSTSDIVEAVRAISNSKRPLIISGGGVLYSSGACDALQKFAEKHGVPVCETQAGKSALPWNHPLQLGAVGVTGSSAANAMASEADLILAIGTRLQDFTTGSHTLFPQARLVSLNVNLFDATKVCGLPLQADARLGLDALAENLSPWHAESSWKELAEKEATAWRETINRITQRRILDKEELPYEGEVIGVIQESPHSTKNDIVVGAAGTLPGELHKLWRTEFPGGYHMEYGYSCMGYEIAGGLGVKMARPDKEVIVMVGDGSYLMLCSEIATSVMLGKKLIIVVLDNQGFGCINRLQQHCGGQPFNNLLTDCLQGSEGMIPIDFAANAASLGALSEHVKNIEEFKEAMKQAREAPRTYVISMHTSPTRTTSEGGWWWEVAVPEESPSATVRQARMAYEQGKQKQKRT